MSTSPLPTKQKSISKLVAGDIIQEGNYVTGFTWRTFVKVDPIKKKGQRWRRITVRYGGPEGKEGIFNTNVHTKFNVVIKVDQIN